MKKTFECPDCETDCKPYNLVIGDKEYGIEGFECPVCFRTFEADTENDEE